IAIVLVDGRAGLTAADERVAELARLHAGKTWLVANKAEGMDPHLAAVEFHRLGLGEPVAISAAHGDRVAALMDEVLSPFVVPDAEPPPDEAEEPSADQ